MEIKSEIKKRTEEIERVLHKYLPPEDGYQKVVMEAMNYSLLSGGKRLRPMLMLETYRMFGGSGMVIEPFMAAVEMIHTYSLVHDDLPAMDDDAYRRGRKTTHVVYGEAMGILAGDALLNFAFETAAQAFSLETNPQRAAQASQETDLQRAGQASQETELQRAAQALQILAKKAGIYGMLGGQAVDVQNENNPDIDGEMLDFIYRLKTGALLEASMMIGAVLAGAGSYEVSVLEQAAKKAGIAFQIQDDILDRTSTLEELGKPIGSDEKNQKATYVSMYGMEAAKQKVEDLTKEAMAKLETLPVKNEFLNELLLYLAGRRS